MELCEFPDAATTDAPPEQDDGVLRPGIHALAFATMGSVARTLPGGVRIEVLHA